ncbi:MAG: gliding motility protein GldB [Dysgonamonadaceae bacterium]|nr:gliding motility protein GldB [Dysgonamonadaceae bacterium]
MKYSFSVCLKIVAFFLFSFLFFDCSGKKNCDGDCSELNIIRFDNDLFNYLNDNDSVFFLNKNRFFLDEFGKNVLEIGDSDSAGFYSRLKKYFSDSTLMRLYNDEQEKFNDITGINSELHDGMEILLQHFPALQRPKIYLHVSGFNQNVIVDDSILSLSADKYLGSDYSLYQDYFYDYQRQLMTPERIVPDYLLGFMMANFPFRGNDDVLLDRMLYEGKLRYILSRLLVHRNIWESTGYSMEQHEWCCRQESRIWKTLLENKHLFSSSYLTVEQYLKPAPYTASLSGESPGRVGVWLGFRIIDSYMKNNPATSFAELIQIDDYRELLRKSKYRP